MTLWRPIPGHAGYEAHPDGVIRSISRTVKGRDGSDRRISGKVLTAIVRPDGTEAVNLWANNTYKQVPIKVLVAQTFAATMAP